MAHPLRLFNQGSYTSSVIASIFLAQMLVNTCPLLYVLEIRVVYGFGIRLCEMCKVTPYMEATTTSWGISVIYSAISVIYHGAVLWSLPQVWYINWYCLIKFWYYCVVKATHDITLACIGQIAFEFRHTTYSCNCLYTRASGFWLWDLVLLLWIQPLNYTARYLKQFLKVSTELVNITKVPQEQEHLARSTKTTETHNCIFRRCANVVLQLSEIPRS